MSRATLPVVDSSLLVSMPEAPSVAGTSRRGSSPPLQRRATSSVLAVSLINRERYCLPPGAGCRGLPRHPADGSRVGHGEDVEGGVQLLLGQLALLDVAAFHDHLPDRLLLGQRLLGDLRRLLVADVLV